MTESLADRVIAVAGAAGSLGPSVVQRLATAGSRVCACGRDRASLEALAADAGAEIDIDVVDLLDANAARTWAANLAERHAHIDGLVHLVGGWRGGTPIEDAPLEEWAFLEPLLVRTLQNATQAFVPALLDSDRGRVVVISTGQAQAPTHKNAVYAAGKAAAEAWTIALADRFRGTGATANIVVVGAIVTPAMKADSPEKDFSTFTPAEDIADAIAYICSDAAATMNGQRLTLRGAA